jgi:lipopolysaccharide assembly protein A
MKVLFWFVVLVIAVVLALFAVSNRAPAALAFWPLGFVVEVPLYLAVLAALLTGFVAGALTAWLAGRSRRREARRRRRRIAVLERELAATQAQLPGALASGASR